METSCGQRWTMSSPLLNKHPTNRIYDQQFMHSCTVHAQTEAASRRSTHRIHCALVSCDLPSANKRAHPNPRAHVQPHTTRIRCLCRCHKEVIVCVRMLRAPASHVYSATGSHSGSGAPLPHPTFRASEQSVHVFFSAHPANLFRCFHPPTDGVPNGIFCITPGNNLFQKNHI